jgi:tetratricopeptide (TPR) repeat protein
MSHGGGINGFNTLITRSPSDKSLIVLLNNTGGAPLRDMANAIRGILYSKPYDFPKKSVANALYDSILTNGLKTGLSNYDTLKSSGDYELIEDEMNSLGYKLLQSDKVDEALAVFKLNVEEFPKSFNAYDSYAEALMTKGDTEMAIANYKKSVELNPNNQNGIDYLKRLGADVSEFEKEIVVPDAILQSYIGSYELMPQFIIEITKDGSQLKAKATNQPVFDIFPQSETIFYLKVVDAKLTFNKNATGAVESVTLLQGGREMTGKKM